MVTTLRRVTQHTRFLAVFAAHCSIPPAQEGHTSTVSTSRDFSRPETGSRMSIWTQFPKHMASGGSLPRPSKKERVKPGEGQESVWEYPRPPICKEAKGRKVVIKLGNTVIATTQKAWRMMEESHPPTWYIPLEDIEQKYLKPSNAIQTTCEFKGQAKYYDVIVGSSRIKMTSWEYPIPSDEQKEIKGKMAFYINKGLDAWVDGDKAKPQEGDFYGGWITKDVVGPFKGGPGTRFW